MLSFALCPGYLFAKLPPGTLTAALSAPYVRGVVGVAGEPVAMRPDDIAYLQLLSGRSERVAYLLKTLSVGQVLDKVATA